MLLSICIPYYDRCDNLKKIISSVCEARSNNFELLIVDNVSPQKVEDVIDIKDDRIRVVRREKAVYGAENVGTCMYFAKGEFCLLCLDKDMITGGYIDDFLDVLSKYEGRICGGYCELNVEPPGVGYQIFNNNPIFRFGYLSKHPTGNFYKTNEIKKMIDSDKMKSSLLADPFIFDIELAECSVAGPMMLYNLPLVTSKLDNYNKHSRKTKSLSFSGKNDTVYFFAKNRICNFCNYVLHMKGLNLNHRVLLKKTKDLYGQTLKNITLGLRSVAGNKYLAYHYSYKPWKVTIFEMIQNCINLHIAFMRLDTQAMNIFEKRIVEIVSIINLMHKAFSRVAERRWVKRDETL